jgi:hypothetical protein
MKISLPRILNKIIAAPACLAFALIISSTCFASHGSRVTDSILIQKKTINRSYKIGLYPDAVQKAIFFTVRGIEGKVYQLYLFDLDLDGKLVKQIEIRNKQISFISEMEKGTYVFDVFCDDDKIGNGQIAIR